LYFAGERESIVSFIDMSIAMDKGLSRGVRRILSIPTKRRSDIYGNKFL